MLSYGAIHMFTVLNPVVENQQHKKKRNQSGAYPRSSAVQNQKRAGWKTSEKVECHT